jgi:MFS family permease
VVQGTGAALVTPSSLALIGAVYPKAERNRAVGVWAAASALTTAAGPVLGGWLTETFGWQAVFWINPPIAVATVVLLWAFAGADERVPRRFDIIGAGIIAAALGALAWSLSQIGHEAAADPLLPVAGGLLGFIGLVAYGFWERITDHPMTPPRLAQNRPFLALNIATLVIYAGLAVMFFLLPFDLIDRRGLSSTAAGLSLLPMALGVGLLSRPFGALADKIGTRTMLIAGPLGAAFAFFWLAFAQNASLTVGVLVPMTLLGISFAALVTPLTASVLSSVAQADEGLASGVNNAASRVAQLVGVALGAGLGTVAGGHRMGFIAAAAFMLAGAAVMAISKTPGKPQR